MDDKAQRDFMALACCFDSAGWERALHAVNNIDRITAERDGLRKALEKLDALLDFGSTWDCTHCFDDVGAINEASQKAYELLVTLRVSDAAQGGGK